MRKILPLLTVVCVSFCLSAQISISVNPTTTTGSGAATSPDIGAYCTVTNNSLFPINLMWSREVVSIPSQWLSWICDKNNCYLPHVSRCPDALPNLLDPGQSMSLEIHVGPGGIEGEAELRIDLFDRDEPDEILGSVQVFFEAGTVSVSDTYAESLRIFPNPATSYFQLSEFTGVDKIVLYSMVGNRMREFSASAGNRFDISELPQGVYIVRILDQGQQVLKTVRLSKK